MNSYDTKIKELARKEQLRFFSSQMKWLGKSPKRLKVACFPGEEEISEVYDPLGIPRGNIVGIEGNPVDFFRQTDDRFDIISFDYEQQLDDDALRSLTIIAGRQLLSQKGLFLTNFHGEEEDDDVLFNYTRSLSPEQADRLEVWMNEDEERAGDDYEPRRRIIARFLEEIDMDMEEYKDIGITRFVLKILGRGKSNMYIPRIFQLDPGYQVIGSDDFEDDWDKFMKRLESEETARETKRCLRTYSSNLLRDVYFFLDKDSGEIRTLRDISPELCHYIRHEDLDPYFLGRELSRIVSDGNVIVNYSCVEEKMSVRLKESLKESGFENILFAVALIAESERPYFPKKVERFRYVKDDGSPMFLDLFSLDQDTRTFDEWKDTFRAIPGQDQLHFAVSLGEPPPDYNDRIIDEKDIREKSLRGKNAIGVTERQYRKYEKWFLEKSKRILTHVAELLKKTEYENPKPRKMFGTPKSQREALSGERYYELRLKAARAGTDTGDLHGELLLTYRADKDELARYSAELEAETYGPTPKSVLEEEGKAREERKRAREERKRAEASADEETHDLYFDESGFMDDVYGAIDTKDKGTKKLADDFALDIATTEYLEPGEKIEFLKALRTCNGGRSLSRLLHSWSGSEYDQVSRLFNRLGLYVRDGKVPTTDDILTECKKAKII
ncbi:MAG: hypothetical protein ISS36_02515 [Candidatus Aenigmarchaeota archaeon]|nr:hypothetical protein [Candidatus Aenigmarchaeota archaeon]